MSLERKTIITYKLPVREVRGAIVAYLKAKNVPAPTYVDDTPDCKWSELPDGGVMVAWTEKVET